jgi:hypothetical protein
MEKHLPSNTRQIAETHYLAENGSEYLLTRELVATPKDDPKIWRGSFSPRFSHVTIVDRIEKVVKPEDEPEAVSVTEPVTEFEQKISGFRSLDERRINKLEAQSQTYLARMLGATAIPSIK